MSDDRQKANDRIENDDGTERRSVASRIADTFTDRHPELFHSPDGTGYTTFEVRGKTETVRTSSSQFKKYLRLFWFNETGKPAPANTINDAAALIDALASFGSREREVWVRVASDGRRIWLDLGNRDGEVVEIGAEGWHIGPCPNNVKFLRPLGLLPLPFPKPGGDFQSLRSLINVTDDGWPLVAAWTLGIFLPDGSYPILFLNGPQNSAKSTATRILRGLTDPNKVFADTLKNDERVLAIAANNQHVLCFENTSNIGDRVSDFLCRMSTGGGYRTRSLFTDQDEVLLAFKRPVLINGIGDLARRPDLLERALIVHCPSIPKEARRRERDVLDDLNASAPGILGALLNGVSAGLAAHDSVPVTEAVRMADFLAFVEAGETALGFEPGTIRAAYVTNQTEANVIALEESPVAAAIRVQDFPNYWEGAASDLLQRLFPDTTERERASRGLPTTPVSMSNALKRVEPNLATLGITVERERTSSSRLIRIKKKVVTPVMASSVPSDRHDDYDSHDEVFSDLTPVSDGRIRETFS